MSFNYSEGDLNNASTTPTNTVKPGEYNFTITHAEERTSKAGNVYASMTCTIDNNGTPRDIKYTNLSFTPKAMPILKRFLDTTGINPPKGASDLVGATGKCVVELNDDGWPEVKFWGADFRKNTAQTRAANNTPKTADDIPF